MLLFHEWSYYLLVAAHIVLLNTRSLPLGVYYFLRTLTIDYLLLTTDYLLLTTYYLLLTTHDWLHTNRNSTSRMLYWRDDVVRVRPFRKDLTTAWQLRRVSDSDCAHWSAVSSRRNESISQWATEVVSVILGECDAMCVQAVRSGSHAVAIGSGGSTSAHSLHDESGSLPAILASRLAPLYKLDESTRCACTLSCGWYVVSTVYVVSVEE